MRRGSSPISSEDTTHQSVHSPWGPGEAEPPWGERDKSELSTQDRVALDWHLKGAWTCSETPARRAISHSLADTWALFWTSSSRFPLAVIFLLAKKERLWARMGAALGQYFLGTVGRSLANVFKNDDFFLAGAGGK